MRELKETRRSVVRERAVLVEVITASDDDPSGHRDRLEELGRLADTAGAEVVATMTQRRAGIHPSTYVGSGKVEELKALVEAHRAHVVIFDSNLSPAQVRNLEKATGTKTIDRSELILDIFATRARTAEAKLQVELAQLEYALPRLKRLWTHLSRMEGGGSGGIATRGPGETQLESDRRMARDRIVELKKKLRTIDARKERACLARGDRLTVGLVGYTNAGKSSLLNALTGSDAYVEDKLFATLDTRTRSWPLPYGLTALLSDTVGFIRDLPHHLVASFKATLEEAVHANLLLHVVDVSTEHVRADLEAVEAVLEEIGCKDKPQLVVLNKADLLDKSREQGTGNGKPETGNRKHPCLFPVPGSLFPAFGRPGAPPQGGQAVATSAKTGQGLEELRAAVTGRLVGPLKEMVIRAPAADGRLQAWIEQHATILDRHMDDGEIVHTVRLPERLAAEISHVARTGARAAGGNT